MVNRKKVSALTIAALLACAVPAKSRALALGSFLSTQALVGQATPTFPVPNSVEQGTEIAVSSGSDNMNAISAALRQGFEGTYANSKVTVETKAANAAIQDVLNGTADLAAISRPLTAAEKQKGLIAVPVRREKIAVVVDKDNPFSNSLTGSQFAQIFRGEIKNWSAVGGPNSAIKLIDRPASSETRQALSPYPVFATAAFEAADGATTLESDTPEALIAALGPSGIGYVLVGELANQPELKALPLHQTPPSDSRYPFSQPYSFVYAGGASPAVSAFLGYATGNPGQAVVNDAGVSGVGLIPNATGGGETAITGNATGTATESAGDSDSAGSDSDSGDSSNLGGAADTSGSETQPGGESTIPGGEVDGATLAASGVAAGPDGIFGTADDIDIAGPDGIFGTADDIDIAGPDGIVGTDDDIEIGPAETGAEVEVVVAEDTLNDQGRWWWLLLPLAGLGLLIWAASKTSSEEETGYIENRDLEGDRSIPASEPAKDGLNAGTPGVKGESVVSTSALSTGDIGSDAPSSLGINREASPAAGVGLGTVAAGGAVVAASSAARESRESGLEDRKIRRADGSESDIDGVKGNIQGDVAGLRGATGSRIEGRRSDVGAATDKSVTDRSVIDKSGETVKAANSGAEGSRIDGTEDKIRADVDTSKMAGNSWLDRAKQRINEATEQAKDAAADLKEDMTDDR